MQPLVTLYERERTLSDILPVALASAYGGDLFVPQGAVGERPYVVANFVETLDGIVSYNAPGQTGGGVISGDNEQDKMTMGLLRAYADAVIFGSSSLSQDANHLRIPAFIYPAFADAYDALRRRLGKQESQPISVIVTTSGHVDLQDLTFHSRELRSVIATTPAGYDYLARQDVPSRTDVRIVEPLEGERAPAGVSPAGVLALLARDYGVRTALYEGGPTLLASFLRDHLVDELFLTLAPHIAGQGSDRQRLSLVEGQAFPPLQSPWAELSSVKLAGSHLLLRYKFTSRTS
jgi:riboflavin biosynthesis pyrimidine reductase